MSRQNQQTQSTSPRLVIAGGGTGGHLYPGIAVVEAIEEMRPEIEVAFVGTEKGIEARVIPELGYDLHLMDVPPLKGQGLAGWVKGGLSLSKSGLQAMSLVRELDPAMTISVGGYAAGPFTLAAAISGRPTALMEQNLEPGMTNSVLGRFVDLGFVAYQEACDSFEGLDCRAVGNPLRRSIRQKAASFRYEPSDDETIRLLVTGGSGGAKSLNEQLPGALCRLGEKAEHLSVRHQYGRNRRSEVEGRYDDFTGEVELVEFIDEMADAYAWCDLIVCRGGGTTIAEILAFGLPAVFVPSPHVTDDQQTKNAREITELGAGIMLPDEAIGSDRATRLISGLIDNPVSLQNIARKARELGQESAAEAIAEACLQRIDSRG